MDTFEDLIGPSPQAGNTQKLTSSMDAADPIPLRKKRSSLEFSKRKRASDTAFIIVEAADPHTEAQPLFLENLHAEKGSVRAEDTYE